MEGVLICCASCGGGLVPLERWRESRIYVCLERDCREEARINIVEVENETAEAEQEGDKLLLLIVGGDGWLPVWRDRDLFQRTRLLPRLGVTYDHALVWSTPPALHRSAPNFTRKGDGFAIASAVASTHHR